MEKCFCQSAEALFQMQEKNLPRFPKGLLKHILFSITMTSRKCKFFSNLKKDLLLVFMLALLRTSSRA